MLQNAKGGGHWENLVGLGGVTLVSGLCKKGRKTFEGGHNYREEIPSEKKGETELYHRSKGSH